MSAMTLGSLRALGAEWNPTLTEEQKRAAKLVYGAAGAMFVVGILGLIFFAARADERGIRGLGTTKRKRKLYAEHVRLNRSGYDSRGRYWGVGQKLYRVSSEDGSIDTYVRADSAAKAKQKVDPAQ